MENSLLDGFVGPYTRYDLPPSSAQRHFQAFSEAYQSLWESGMENWGGLLGEVGSQVSSNFTVELLLVSNWGNSSEPKWKSRCLK